MATRKQHEDREQSENSAHEEIRAHLIIQTSKRVAEEQAENGCEKKQDRCMVYLRTFVAVCSSFALGSYTFQAGYSSPTQSAIREDLNLSIAEAMRVSSAFCVAGWLAIYYAQGALSLDIGRLATGYGMGVFSYVVPVFIAEIAPIDLRGALTTINQLMISTGVSVAFIIGTMLTWRVLALTGLVPRAVLLFGLFIIPESPRWLAKIGHHQEFEIALRRLRGKNADIPEEEAEIQDYIKTLEKLPKVNLFDLFQRRYLRSVIVNFLSTVVFDILVAKAARFPSDIGTIIFAIVKVSTLTLSVLGKLDIYFLKFSVIIDLSACIIFFIGFPSTHLVSATGLVIGCILTGTSFYLKGHEIAVKAAPILALTGTLVPSSSFLTVLNAVAYPNPYSPPTK
ncbi:hypothetical protein RND71_024708 [Anisodus tanguticus]|uniref:Major facilitator superfamily (MFS) profile domain-containing protein n=1 Tax=Anisodus tanguticus TaxID=243964 RepID=A0AAE1RQZ5_9SOLA|nr:hypothetical protein RND71_024708 [Anisodus tanguticus]